MEAAKKNLSSLQLRVLSAVVLCPLVIGLVYRGGLYFMAMMALALAISFYEWCRLVRESSTKDRDTVIGAVYLMVCFISFAYIRFGFGFEQGWWLALSTIVSVWVSDSSAYLVGKKFGKRKLAPKISPNKTWVGFAAAMFFFGLTLAVMIGVTLDLKSLHIGTVFAGGCLLGAVGQVGDLLKSIFKRRAGVKDSGNLIPGHGGLLDRIDSLLLVSPVFLWMLLSWME